MIRLLAARLMQSVLVLALVYVATFWMLMAVPGDPFLGDKKPPQSVVDAAQEIPSGPGARVGVCVLHKVGAAIGFWAFHCA